MYRIFMVEDDRKITNILGGHLEKYGYQVVKAASFRDVKNEFMTSGPDLVLLDINLPYYDGYYWCRQIRSISNVPIIFISARVGQMDQVMAIENGGDDYITKPFHLEVVLAKVKGVLRRTYGEYAAEPQTNRDLFHFEGLYLDRGKQTAEWKDSKVELSPIEFRLLECLARQAESIVPREELLEALWDNIDFVDDNTLTVNVTRVRKKLEMLGITRAIDTIRGQGYRLQNSWRDA